MRICVVAQNLRNMSNRNIRIDKPPNGRVIVPTPQIVQPGFLIADIAAIAEEIALAPRIVLVFYDKLAGAVKQPMKVS